MTEDDISIIAPVVATATKEAVEREVPSILRMVDEKLAALPKAEKGDRGNDGAAGPQGPAGERGEAGPAGATGADGATGPQGMPGERGADGVDGKDGRDGVDGKDGARGPQGDVGAPGDQGPPGLDGEKGADGEDGRDGRDGKDGPPGRDAADIEILAAIDEARSYPRGTFAKHRGGLWRAFEQTAAMRGWECVVDGVAGASFDYDESTPRELRCVIELSSGEKAEVDMRAPMPVYRGVYREGDEYGPGDMATWAGSMWHCFADTKDKPGEPGSKGWTLAVKRGRDGADAPKPPPSLTMADVVRMLMLDFESRGKLWQAANAPKRP
jgi:hypothetical protein